MLPSLLLVVLLYVHACVPRHPSHRTTSASALNAAAPPQANLTCVPHGLCERCPEKALHQPYCQPFGNRRLMHCGQSELPLETDVQDPPPQKGKLLAWESCGRVVLTERADFFEFIAVNLMFSCLGIGFVVWRSRRMQVVHARQLAARIGLPGRRQ